MAGRPRFSIYNSKKRIRYYFRFLRHAVCSGELLQRKLEKELGFSLLQKSLRDNTRYGFDFAAHGGVVHPHHQHPSSLWKSSRLPGLIRMKSGWKCEIKGTEIHSLHYRGERQIHRVTLSFFFFFLRRSIIILILDK